MKTEAEIRAGLIAVSHDREVLEAIALGLEEHLANDPKIDDVCLRLLDKLQTREPLADDENELATFCVSATIRRLGAARCADKINQARQYLSAKADKNDGSD